MRRFMLILLAVSVLSLSACTPGERFVGAAAIGALSAATIVAVLDASHHDQYGHGGYGRGYDGRRPSPSARPAPGGPGGFRPGPR